MSPRDYRYASVLADLEQILLLGRAVGPTIPVMASVPLAEVIDADAHMSGRSRARSGWIVTAEEDMPARALVGPNARGRWVVDPDTPGQELWVHDETAPSPAEYVGPIIEGEIVEEKDDVMFQDSTGEKQRAA
jgi:hypothetical protein